LFACGERLDHSELPQLGDLWSCQSTERLRWWLLSYGDRIEVLGPPNLKAEIGQMTHRMFDRYQTNVAGLPSAPDISQDRRTYP